MSWVTKTYHEGSSHRAKEGKYDREDSSDEDRQAESDQDEDLDRAIALSLVEEQERKGKKVFVDEEPPYWEDESYLDEDEQLARVLQASMNIIESPPEHIKNHNYYRPNSQPHSYSKTGGSRVCAGCKNRIGRGRYLTCMKSRWHPQCFCCQACKQPIADREFTVGGLLPYHKSCYKKQNYPKCNVCRKFIPPNSVGHEYLAHPLWSEKYCPSHEHDRTPRCCSCQRLEPRDARYIFLGAGDGRKLCLKCLDSAIMSNEECQPLILDIKEFFEGLNMKITQEFPILMVKRSDLNEAVEGELDPSRPLSEVRGVCTSQERTVPSVRRRPRRSGNGFTDVETEPYRLERVSQVTGVLVIYGLPRLLTGSILAHELMHAWMRLNGYRDIRLEIEEGICQVLGHMWLEAEIMAGSGGSSYLRRRPRKNKRSPFEKTLGEFFKYQIELDGSPVYGDGYRAATKAVATYGLYETLKHIKRTGNLP